MDYLDEAHLGYHRIEALVDRESVWLALLACGEETRQRTEAWLAMLGWTAVAYLEEAFPEGWGR